MIHWDVQTAAAENKSCWANATELTRLIIASVSSTLRHFQVCLLSLNARRERNTQCVCFTYNRLSKHSDCMHIRFADSPGGAPLGPRQVVKAPPSQQQSNCCRSAVVWLSVGAWQRMSPCALFNWLAAPNDAPVRARAHSSLAVASWNDRLHLLGGWLGCYM